MDIAPLIARGEGKTLEFKRDLSSHGPVMRTAVAFANTAGGLIVFGIEDDGAITGVSDPFAFQERLASVLSDGVEPRLVPEIDIVAWRESHVVVATVHPGPSKPYYLAARGVVAGTYVRVGSTNRVADEALREELSRSVRREAFDEQPLPGLDSEAVDFRAASESFAGIRPIKRTDMESLGLLVRSRGRLVPTVGGLVLFGTARRTTFPEVWLQAGRFKGSDRARIIDTAEIDLPLPAMADAALAFVKRSIALHMDVSGSARRSETWEYPLDAVREAIVNALVHADYSQTGAPIRLSIFDDRMEIESPGLLVPGLTVDDILSGVSRVRNRVIARVFRELGLVEQWGSGVARMVAACRDAGLSDPEFEEIGMRFRVTLRSAQAAPPRLDPLDERIVTALDSQGQGLSTAQLAEQIGRTTRATRTRLKDLVAEGVVVELGTGPHDPLRRYLLAESRAKYGR